MPLRASAPFALLLCLAANAAPALAGSKTPASDDSLTCPQIAAQLKSYFAPMMPNLKALAGSDQEMVSRAHKRLAERTAVGMGEDAAALATNLDPTGASGKAAGMAQVAQQRAWTQSDEIADKPLHDQLMTQTQTMVAQGQQLQANQRVQHLLQLAQAKGCTH
jgi:hypothetical protein